MATIKSEDLKDGQPVAKKKRPGGPPLPRSWLDSAAPLVRVVFGILFLLWSWASTVLVFGPRLERLFPGEAAAGVPNYALAALVFSFLVSAIEFVASGRWEVVYWAVLLVADASFTAVQTYLWSVLIFPEIEQSLIAMGVVGIGCVILGIVVAKFGEVLLFGTNKR